MRMDTLTKVGAARSNPRMGQTGMTQVEATPNRNGSFHNPARRLHHSPIIGQENISKAENTVSYQGGMLMRSANNAAEGLRFGLMHAYQT